LASLQTSLIQINQSLAAHPDSATRVYLLAQKKDLSRQQSEVLAARDKKVEPFSILADIFLRLIKMIVAPLVLTTLIVGVAKLGDISSVGRIGGKTLLWFVGASLMSLLLGMILVNIFQPGIAMNLPLPDAGEDIGLSQGGMSLKNFLYHVFPTSVIEAMAKNEILQIVVFSLFFGVATAAIGEQGKIVIQFLDAVAHVILKVTGYVMNLAPIAVFGAMAAIIAKQGLGILTTYSIFIGEFYFGLLVLWLLLTLAGFLMIGKRVINLLRTVKEPIILAFSTSSSEAAFPKTMELLQK
ncbi:MAG TPA: dicarboxylate/amino acid:cation symporter, partial [Cytophagales bacterium]|nr:dicarboxylate/amino acid:cation symporter [Cytophagales bacterium]